MSRRSRRLLRAFLPVLVLSACAQGTTQPHDAASLPDYDDAGSAQADASCDAGTECSELQCAGLSYVCGAGQCTGTASAYRCDCPAGYTGTHSQACLDIDECASTTNPCGTDHCVNTLGGYVCQCADAVSDPTRACVSPAAPVPAAPVVEGESSSSHDDVTWRWRAPAHTSLFQVTVDALPVIALPASVTQLTRTLSHGPHSLRIRACNDSGGCSDVTRFGTIVEQFGTDYPPGLRGIRKRLPRTALGNVLALNCHNCYQLADETPLSSDQANAKISRAVAHDADYVEIDVADIRGTLCASHDDPTELGVQPRLEQLLANPDFARSRSMLMLELKETDLAPALFADELLRLLDAHREYVANGRPLLIKEYDDHRVYMAALRDAAPRYPFLRAYLRFWVLFGSFPDTGYWQQLIRSEVVDEHFDGVEIDYRSANLFAILAYAKSRGLGVGLFTIPGPNFGEVLLSSLREEVSVLTTEYRVDQARAIVEAVNALAYVDAQNVRDASSLTMTANATGTPAQLACGLGRKADGARFGSPTLEQAGLGEAFYGPLLRFVAADQQAIQLFELSTQPESGFLVTALVQLDGLGALPVGSTQSLLRKGAADGFALELAHPPNEPAVLRFGVSIDGQYVYHAYPVAGGSADACTALRTESFSEPLSAQRSYALAGAYDGHDGVHLFIDQRCAGAVAPLASGPVSWDALPVLAGASPTRTPPLASSYFEGRVRQLQVQRWTPHDGDEIN